MIELQAKCVVSRGKGVVGTGGKRVNLYTGNTRDPCDDGNCLSLGCTNISTLAVISNGSFAKGYHYWKLNKKHMGFSVYCLQLHMDLHVSQNKKLIFKRKKKRYTELHQS